MTIQSQLFSAACFVGLFFSASAAHAACPLSDSELAPRLSAVTQIVTSYDRTHPQDPTPMPGDQSFDIFCPYLTSTPSAHTHMVNESSPLLKGDSAAYVALLVERAIQTPDISLDDLINLGITFLSCSKQIQEIPEDTLFHIRDAAIDQLMCAREKLSHETYDVLVGVLEAVFELKNY